MRDQFLVEIAGNPDDPAGTIVGDLAELNALFTAWVEQVYHKRVHTETDMAPLERFLAAGAPVPTPAALLTEAFRWSQWRTVTKTATVSLQGNHYEVDAALAGYKVELVFDPFDLTDIDVHHHGRKVGKAVPFAIGRHVHAKAVADAPPPPPPTGIDYLRLVQAQHTRSLGERLQYARLQEPAGQADPTDGTPAGAAIDDGGPERDTYPPDPDGNDDPGNHRSQVGPDPQSEAEPAGLAALPTRDNTDNTPPAAAIEEYR